MYDDIDIQDRIEELFGSVVAMLDAIPGAEEYAEEVFDLYLDAMTWPGLSSIRDRIDAAAERYPEYQSRYELYHSTPTRDVAMTYASPRAFEFISVLYWPW